MRLVTDLHVHSKYSRATSKNLSPEGLIQAAKMKGIDVIGTGDFTHPKYLRELKEKLIPSDLEGFFVLKDCALEQFPMFMLTQEISCIYTENGRGRRNHILITAPDFKAVDRLAERLGKVGNLASDGRPILGMSSEELAKIVFDASGECMVIPAHIWTPWFSVFGSKSGFDSLAKELIDKGVVYVGSSAGSVLVCPTIAFVEGMDDPKVAPSLKSYRGLNEVELLVMPHYGDQDYKEVYREILERWKHKGFELKLLANDEALIVEDNNSMVVRV